MYFLQIALGIRGFSISSRFRIAASPLDACESTRGVCQQSRGL